MPILLGPPQTADWLFQELIAARLLTPTGAAQALHQFQGAGDNAKLDAVSLAAFLVEAGLLSSYQADRALVGQARKLVLGPYLLVEPAGVGSLGTVYRAVHQSTRQRVAVKVLPVRSLWNVLQAKRQVAIFADLSPHSAVVPFLDIDTAAGSHYLAWPFVEGEGLDSLIARTGPLAPARAAKFFADVADGLAVCHAQGIVHGLIKPSNLLLGPDHRAKILDLGVGAILQENVADEESLLDTISIAHMARAMIDCAAPETLAEPTHRTSAGDLYSLGCALYYVLTGHYPFPDGNTVDKIIAHQTTNARPIHDFAPNVPVALVNVAEALMQKLPEARPTAVETRELLLASVPLDSQADLPAPALVHEPPPWESLAIVELTQEILFDQPPSRPSTRPLKRELDSESLNLFETDSSLGVTPPNAAPVDAPRRNRGAIAPVNPPPKMVNWAGSTDSSFSGGSSEVVVPLPPRFAGLRWKRALRQFLPWVRSGDVVQLSLFCAPELIPGQTYRFQVYAHPPHAFASVRTLSRAFQPENRLRAAGYAGKPVVHGSEIGLHLALSNVGIGKSIVRFKWVGQTKPWAFEVYIPWECPTGLAHGMLTVGLNDYQSAEIAFSVGILPRSG